uniref:Uncharacterized protein n=1 Tax=Rhizophora mucronata TaxID=61149 RepID=A0A2P2JLW7_RHIMU
MKNRIITIYLPCLSFLPCAYWFSKFRKSKCNKRERDGKRRKTTPNFSRETNKILHFYASPRSS